MDAPGNRPQERTLVEDVADASKRLGLRLTQLNPNSAVYDAGGVEMTVAFDALARQWRNTAPEQRPVVVENFLRAMNSVPNSSQNATYEQVRDKLIVRVAQSNYAQMPGIPDVQMPPKWDIVPGHLSVFIAVDEPEIVSTATSGNLREWGLNFEQAYDVGLENLRRRTDPRLQKAFPPYPAIRYYQGSDAYDASRALLLGDLVQPWPAGGVVFGVPTRDHLFWSVVNGQETLQALNYMLQLNAKALEEGTKPMTDQLFWFDGATFQVIQIAWTEAGPQPGRPPPGLIAAIMAGR